MDNYDLKDRRFRKKDWANVSSFEFLKYGDTYVAGDDSLGDYIDQVFDTLEGKLNRVNRNINSLNKITEHLDEGPPDRSKKDKDGKSLREEWFDDLRELTSEAGIRFLSSKDKQEIESDLGIFTSDTFSFEVGKNWEKDIRDSVSKQENQIKKDNAQTYNWFQKISQDQSIDAVKETLYEMSPEGFTDAIKNSTKGLGKDTAFEGVKFQDIADPQFAEYVYEREGTSQLGREVSQFLKGLNFKTGEPRTPPEAPVDVAQSVKAEDARIAAQEKEAEQQAIRDIDVGAISQSIAGTGVADLVGADDSALAAQKEEDEYEDIADFAGMFGGEGSTAGLDVADSETPQTTTTTTTTTGSNVAALAAQQEADRDEIYQLLTEQFGGASYFFRNHEDNMLIWFNSENEIVSYDDPEAETHRGLMDYIVENGITSPARVKGLLQKTKWWQTTDKERRFFDVTWGEMSGPEQAEWLEPVTKALQDEAQYLGVELSDERAFELGQMLAMEGNGDDQEEIRKILFNENVYTGVSAEISEFSGAIDNIKQLANTYYSRLPDEEAQQWAEWIYTGERTEGEYEQYLKTSASALFPTLDRVINELGVTPQQYFAPYKQQIEQMLGRQVDMLEEFSDVIEYIPDTGGTTSRPMTLSEVRKFVRATPEWQQTDDAKDQARALAFSIGQSFGEVA
tara:strand:+ start:7969 stop:10008 length:2040 start_codon:yes stop_codon:yes gene_type:complete